MTGGEADDEVGTSVHRALDRLDEAASLSIPDGEPVAGELLALRSRALWLLGRWEEATVAADEAVKVLRSRPESVALARALARRSQLAMLRSEDRAEELCREALAVANRVGDALATINVRINLLSTRANMSGVAPDPVEVLEVIEKARGSGATDEGRRALVNFVWSASGYFPVNDILETLGRGEELLAGTPVPAGLLSYLPVSVATLQLLPAGRWSEIDAMLDRVEEESLTATNRMPWLGLTAQLALRRGDVETAGQRVREQHRLAIRSGEPQRLVPMACAFLPWAHVAGEPEQLAEVASDLLELLKGHWSGITALPAVRALAAAGELDLLARWSESLGADVPSGRTATSASAAAGLLALHSGRPADAIGLLEAAARRDRELGYDLDAALVDLDVASALDALGKADEGHALRSRSDTLLASVGCVHSL